MRKIAYVAALLVAVAPAALAQSSREDDRNDAFIERTRRNHEAEFRQQQDHSHRDRALDRIQRERRQDRETYGQHRDGGAADPRRGLERPRP